MNFVCLEARHSYKPFACWTALHSTYWKKTQLLLKMAIEFVDLPMKHVFFLQQTVSFLEGRWLMSF